MIILLLVITVAVCIMGWNAHSIPPEFAKEVLAVSLCLWVVGMFLFFDRWFYWGGSSLCYESFLLSVFFGFLCSVGLKKPDLAVAALHANAEGSVVVLFIVLYIFSPAGEEGMHDHEE